MGDAECIFKYVPFNSFVHSSFWYKLSELKLDVDKLSDTARTIYGYYTNSNANLCSLEVDCTSFNQNIEKSSFISHGILYNKNTIEEFKNCDKIHLLNTEGSNLWKRIENGDCIKNPSLLSTFVLLSFADLKNHNYYYWFAFPTLSQPVASCSLDNYQLITTHFKKSEVDQLNELYFKLGCQCDAAFFIIERQEADFLFKTLQDKINHLEKATNFLNSNLDNLYFCFADPSSFENAGWPLRLFIVMLTHFCPVLRGKTIKILSFRVKNSVCIRNSLIFKIRLPVEDVESSNLKWIGWEPSHQGKYVPKLAAMAETMDPEKLASSSVNLNLKLMKWRVMPDLDLNIISETKCLLMGAGTLGCSVARNLLAWGVNNITFVDYGKVSYSNPVRQSLFIHEDALNGGKEKCTAAAKRLKEIAPGIISTGHNIHIPMPGHTIGPSMMEQAIDTINKLEKLVQEHDVLFLLTDSRESRWLPTLLGAYFNKIVINAALGFDSYLVMRHGSRVNLGASAGDASEIYDGLKCIKGDQLGCYFCNDITAPGNSMKDRTLDQQCTVTRPGVSNIAGSLAVELLVSILQHKEKELAPAYISKSITDTRSSIPEGILGIIPHSIRGMLSSYDQILPATERFPQCIACSEKVLAEYKAKGNEFLLNVFETAKYLEDLTGITELINAENEIIEFSGSDFEMSD